jgi:FKBP-type peptidyl-prolyl cis-trans isomerase FkpA
MRLSGTGSCALAGIVGLVLAAACSPSLTSPSIGAPFSQIDLQVGTGATAEIGDTLAVAYTGWLYDPSEPDEKGPQFDASREEPFVFVLGSGQVIEGWERGVVGMQVGGLRRLIIPPSLAYGGTRSGTIPPFATLVFEVELLNVE